MSNVQVRKLLNGERVPDSEFDAFCLDYFSDVRRNFSAAMDRTTRINLLLEVRGAEDVADAWNKHQGRSVRANQSRAFHVQQQLSPHFTGREEMLRELRTTLNIRRSVALWGLGGMGKTQTALAFAHRHRDDYGAVLFITGDSTGSFERGLFDLARPLALAGRLPATLIDEHDAAVVRQAVMDHLRQANDYLLICDNADEPLSLKQVWPRQLGGHALLTSRSQDIRRLGAVVVEVDKLSFYDSGSYLMRFQPARGTDEEQALAELARELHGLPLALAQAAAYLARHQSRYDAYLRGYRKKKLRLLEQGLLDEEYPYSVATTWAMSIEQVERASSASLDLLKLCAVLHPDAIPEELLCRPVEELGLVLQNALLRQETDEQALDELLAPLLCHALVQRNPAARVLSVHRLVQQAILQRMPEIEQKQWVTAAIIQVNRAFPKITFSVWPQCRRLLPQVSAMAEHIRRYDLADPSMGRLFDTAAQFLHEQAQFGEAEPLFRDALAIREGALGSEHPDVAVSLNNLAMGLRALGRLDDAEPILRRALAIREKAYGPEHTDVAESLNDLAVLLDDQGRFSEAEPFHRRALAIKEKTLPPDDPLIATSRHNLAWLLHAQGQFAEAEILFRSAISIYENALGIDHPDVAHPLHGLATLLLDQGHLDVAEPLFRRALDIREDALPDGHPRIAQTRSALEKLLATKAAQ